MTACGFPTVSSPSGALNPVGNRKHPRDLASPDLCTPPPPVCARTPCRPRGCRAWASSSEKKKKLDNSYSEAKPRHHIPESLSELTLTVYLARRLPLQVGTRQQALRSAARTGSCPASA